MPRQPKPWWYERKGAWCTDIGGKRHILAKGKRNKKQAAQRWKALLDEKTLLSNFGGAITVATLCEAFLADASASLSPKQSACTVG